jgi:hypothetical protein
MPNHQLPPFFLQLFSLMRMASNDDWLLKRPPSRLGNLEPQEVLSGGEGADCNSSADKVAESGRHHQLRPTLHGVGIGAGPGDKKQTSGNHFAEKERI